jgi:hypothetical protein
VTDRIHSITVVLEQDMRVDDAEALLTAIRMLRGVLSAEGNVTQPSHYVAETRVRFELERKLWQVFHPKQDES